MDKPKFTEEQKAEIRKAVTDVREILSHIDDEPIDGDYEKAAERARDGYRKHLWRMLKENGITSHAE